MHVQRHNQQCCATYRVLCMHVCTVYGVLYVYFLQVVGGKTRSFIGLLGDRDVLWLAASREDVPRPRTWTGPNSFLQDYFESTHPSIHPFFPMLPTGRGRRGGGLPSLTLSGCIALRCDGEAQQRNQQGRCQALNPWFLFSVGLSLSYLGLASLNGAAWKEATEYGGLAARIEITSVIFSLHLEIPCFMWHCG